MYCDKVMTALLLYMEPIHGSPDPHASISNSISPQAIAQSEFGSAENQGFV